MWSAMIKESIFIEGKFKAQEATLTSNIFDEDSSFQIFDQSEPHSPSFHGKGRVPSKMENAVNDQHKNKFSPGMLPVQCNSLLTVLVAICLVVRHTRRDEVKNGVNDVVKTDINDLCNTYHEGGVENSTAEVSSCKSVFSH